MTPLNVRAFATCYGVGMALGGEVPVDVLATVLGDEERAVEENWRMQTARRDRQVKQSIPIPGPIG